MKPLERSQTEMIEHLEKIIIEQNRRLQYANQQISELKREIEVNDEFVAYQMQSLIENYEEAITTILTPSLN
jgi:hypothetical protein